MKLLWRGDVGGVSKSQGGRVGFPHGLLAKPCAWAPLTLTCKRLIIIFPIVKGRADDSVNNLKLKVDPLFEISETKALVRVPTLRLRSQL